AALRVAHPVHRSLPAPQAREVLPVRLGRSRHGAADLRRRSGEDGPQEGAHAVPLCRARGRAGGPRRNPDPARSERPRLRRNREGPGAARRNGQVEALPGTRRGGAEDSRAPREPQGAGRVRVDRPGGGGNGMSCRELERLFLAGAPEADAAAHRESCAECARLGSDLDRIAASAADLLRPTWSPHLRQALLDIPRLNVSWEGAGALIAAGLEGEIEADDEARLRRHLARCAGCSEAAATLAEMRSLAAPEPPPWLATRLAAARPPKKKS